MISGFTELIVFFLGLALIRAAQALGGIVCFALRRSAGNFTVV